MNNLEKNCKVVEAKDLELDNYILTENGYKKIKSIEADGESECYDIMLLKDDDLFINEENFVLGNGVVSHNCHLSIVSDTVKLIEKTRGIKLKRNDIPIDDRDAIKFSSKEDTLGIFQLESVCAENLSKNIGLTTFQDICNATSLLRPGPLALGMDKEYADRKKGKEYHIPECLNPVLGDTKGILIFQEQCFPYDVNIYTTRGYEKIGDIVKNKIPTDVYCFDENCKMVIRPVEQFHDNGIKEVFKLTLDNGKTVECTNDHKFLVKNRGWVPLYLIGENDEIITEDDIIESEIYV